MQQAVTDDQEISLRDIFDALNRQRRIILLCMAVTVLGGLIYAIFTTPLYTASTTLRPVSEEGAGALGGLASQFGGVASLAGINLGSGGSDKEEYLAILKSRALAERFINHHNVKPHLFPDRWDADAGKWKGGDGQGSSGGGLRSWLSSILVTLSGDEGARVAQGPGPSMWDAYKEFSQNIRTVNEDMQTGIVTVSFEFRNPRLAAEWANSYVAMANQEIRKHTVEEASRALEYLNREVETTTVTGLRETVYKLVETQLERIMLANARDEYAFKVIDRAVAPEDRSHPKRALIVVLSLVLGAMLGVFVALVREAWRGFNSPS